jgi:thymidine kinase
MLRNAFNAKSPALSMATQGDGSIELILGPMWSGKTSMMFAKIRSKAYADHECLVVKYRKDVRYSQEGAATHSGIRMVTSPSSHESASIRVVDVEKLAEAKPTEGEVVIGIDEGFYADLAEMCEKWANQGKTVIVAALDGTYQRKPFGQVLDLIPLAETVTKLNAVCMKCKSRPAAFTERLNYNPEFIVIGAKETYRATCRRCWTEPLKPADDDKKSMTIDAASVTNAATATNAVNATTGTNTMNATEVVDVAITATAAAAATATAATTATNATVPDIGTSVI